MAPFVLGIVIAAVVLIALLLIAVFYLVLRKNDPSVGDVKPVSRDGLDPYGGTPLKVMPPRAPNDLRHFTDDDGAVADDGFSGSSTFLGFSNVGEGGVASGGGSAEREVWRKDFSDGDMQMGSV